MASRIASRLSVSTVVAPRTPRQATVVQGVMGDVAQGIKSFKKGIADDEAAPADDPEVIEHKADKPAPKTAARAKAPRKQKSG